LVSFIGGAVVPVTASGTRPRPHMHHITTAGSPSPRRVAWRLSSPVGRATTGGDG